MATFHTFDEKAIAAAVEAAANQYDASTLQAKRQEVDPFDDGHIRIGAQCISVTVENGKICLNLPLGIGKYCLPIPSVSRTERRQRLA